MLEVGVTDHLVRNIGGRAAAAIIPIAIRAPRIKSIDAAAVADVDLYVGRPGEPGGLPRQHLLERARDRDIRFTLAHDEHRFLTVVRDVDAVQAGT